MDLEENRFAPGEWVEIDVPEVEGIGPAYTTRGTVASHEAGHLVVIDCQDGENHWREAKDVRRVEQ